MARLLALAVWILWALSLTGQQHSQAADPATRPNIVFLLADDMRFDAFGAGGNAIIHTPNIDRLAADGCRFRNHFDTTSICCVSRASILSGQYASRHGIEDFNIPLPPQAWAQTYPALLQAAGYYTALIGHLGVGNDTPATYDYAETHPDRQAYFTPGNPEHLTAHIGDQAVKCVAQLPRSKPFCLAINFSAPHAEDGAPREFPPDHRDEKLYVDAVWPHSASADEAAFRALPDFVQRSEGRKRWERRFATPTMFEKTAKDYFRLVTGVDREVGRVVAALDAAGFDASTVIVFSSDNGFFLGEHGMADKWLMYEPSIRVPLIIYDPRLSAQHRGRHVDALTLNIDMAPTLLDYAGVEIPATMQGRSLLPFLAASAGAAPPANWRTDFFYEHHTRPQMLPASEGVRTADLKYIRYVEPNPLVEELYDLKADPDERRNLAHDKSHEPALQQLRARWAELRAAAR
jgi:arylsulfatase A-like enzyme